MNWIAIIVVGVLVAGLVMFTIIRNQKDKKELEQKIINDYQKQKDVEGDIEIEG